MADGVQGNCDVDAANVRPPFSVSPYRVEAAPGQMPAGAAHHRLIPPLVRLVADEL